MSEAGPDDGKPAPGGFDPWTASLEEAMAAHAGDPGPSGPLFQWGAAQAVLSRRAAVESGDGGAVLDAVAECALRDLVMPYWLAVAFLAKWRDVRHYRAKSWDAAFGSPHPKGVQLAAKRRRVLNRARIARLVHEFVQRFPDQPLDPHWEEWGKAIGEGKTRAQELYAEAIRFGHAIHHGDLRQHNGWPREPRKFRKVAGRLKHR